MGEVEWGRNRLQVRSWPASEEACVALEQYIAEQSQLIGDPPLWGTYLDFRGADLSGMELPGAWINGAKLDGVRFAGADLGHAWINGSSLHGADFSDCLLSDAQLSNCTGCGTSFDRMWFISGQAADTTLRGCTFIGADLGASDWLRADLRDSDLRDVKFDHTSLRHTKLAGVRLNGSAGSIVGPIDIGAEVEHLVDDDELESWFRERGGDGVSVISRRP